MTAVIAAVWFIGSLGGIAALRRMVGQ